jgi:hypothetical protein
MRNSSIADFKTPQIVDHVYLVNIAIEKRAASVGPRRAPKTAHFAFETGVCEQLCERITR